jgi:beta-galactosidase
MNRSFFLLLLFLTACQQYNSTSEIRAKIPIQQDWQFQMGEELGETSWKSVHLPHTPTIEPLVVNDQWQGVCWYQKTIPFALTPKGKRHFLHFEGVMHDAQVWINNQKVQAHKGGYLPFTVDLTDHLNYGSDNKVLVKVKNTDDSTIPPGKPLKGLDFNYYGGIYRNVSLTSTENIYITDPVHANKPNSGGVLVHFDQISSEEAKGTVKIHLNNKSNQVQDVKAVITLTDTENYQTHFTSEAVTLEPNKDAVIEHKIAVSTPFLWSPETPNLYEVDITIVNANQSKDYIDKTRFTTGIRKIELNEEGFFLNDEKRFLNGTNRHQEYPYVGYALPDNAHYRDAYKIKQAGFDFVRLSHYPQSKSFLDACDELGLMVMTCIAGWQYYEEGEFVENALQDIRDFVRRDRHHPSIVFWENSLNESAMTDAFMEQANKIVREELPHKDTYTAGWIDHPSYDLFIPARQHSKPPDYWSKYDNHDRKILIAEYGDWEYYAHNAGFNQHEFKDLSPEQRTSRQLRSHGEKRLLQQATNFQEAFNSNRIGKNTIGHANWLMFDYNRGYADDLEASGISDIFRIPKFANSFYTSQKPPYQDAYSQPMVSIASYWEETSSPTIMVYSNCDEVALFLNGKNIGKRKAERTRISEQLDYPPFAFSIPSYEKGTLEAVGYINGEQVAKHTVKTPGKAVAIQLEIDESGKPLQKGEDDLVFIYAKLVDENNTVVTSVSDKITFSIDNDKAELIGTTAVNLEAGIASCLLRTNYTEETITISVNEDTLKGDEIIIFEE